LMQQIMHYDGEFRPRRGDLHSRLSREALTAVRVDLSTVTNSTPPPCWTGGGSFAGAKDRSLCYGP
jgi:hypothetical protein